jgi:transglutaminase-like putative cysteine protease
LLERLNTEWVYDPDPAHAGKNAPEAFARKAGAAADLTHIFIGAAHRLGIPARFIAGYFCQAEDGIAQTGHSWAEAYVPDLGWVGFDPTNGFCPTDAHVRVAVGLDALGAAPVRGARYGVGGEACEVAIKVGQ